MCFYVLVNVIMSYTVLFASACGAVAGTDFDTLSDAQSAVSELFTELGTDAQIVLVHPDDTREYIEPR